MKPHLWDMTRFYESETSDDIGAIKHDLRLVENELPVASSIQTATDWTFVTTRKVIGRADNEMKAIAVQDIDQWNWGDFKGYRDKTSTRIALTASDGQVHDFIIESGNASMVMIYAIQTLAQLTKKK